MAKANSNTPISRRTVLRGAGAMLALPFLEAMLPQSARAAAAAGGPPVRMGIFTVTGGTVLESWTPKDVGALTKLPSILRPLEFAKQEMTVISGLAHGGSSDNVNGHENCAFKHLTGADIVRREGGRPCAGISVDQAAAKVIGDQTFLPSLEIGMTNQEQVYSFRGRDLPVPYEAEPRLIFERMFRGRQPAVPNWANRAQTPLIAVKPAVQTGDKSQSDEQSVVDLVLERAKSLRGRLGYADKQKLDGYLESVHSVEKRIAFVEARHQQELQDLAHPGPSRLNIPASLAIDRRLLNEDPEKHRDYIRLLADMMVLAFQTDTTRVVTLAAGDDGCMFPGVVTVGYETFCHTLEHQGNAGDAVSREALRQIHEWYTDIFAEMIQKMQSIDEGGSSLLDNSMILYTSYMADGGHGTSDYPALLMGKAGGTLKPGRHLAFKDRAPVSNLYVEMLNRVGAKCDTFGDAHTSTYAGSLNGRIPGLA